MTIPPTALPYTIHTNRELGMMLRGAKPLACFSDVYGTFPVAVLRYLRLFDRHVYAGRFVKCEYVTIQKGQPHRLHVILYALSTEQWRVDAMIELRARLVWSEACERREGELLGYGDLENDLWMTQFASS